MLKPKLLKRIGLSALILLIAFVGAGFAEVYFSDQKSASDNLKPTATALYQQIKPPPAPGPNANVGVAEQAFDNPVNPGSNTSMIIQTTAGAKCTLVETNSSGKQVSSPGLVPKTADAYGSVTWSWYIPKNTIVGDYPVKVTCRLGKNWAVYDDTLTVTD